VSTGYQPDDLLGDIFTELKNSKNDNHDVYSDLADDTLLEALKYKGGKGVLGATRILLRCAAAALLNAAHPDVPYYRPVHLPWGIINKVNIRLDVGERSVMLLYADELDAANNQFCPLKKITTKKYLGK
jgi:hypothetical protein